MARLRDLKVVLTLDSHRLLRYTAVIVNVGPGPFEVRGARPDTSVPEMSVTQRVYDDSPLGYRDVSTAASMFFAGDGHNHWHVRDLETADVRALGGAGPVRALAKHGFCFFDNTKFDLTLAGAPGSPRYQGCGASGDTSVTTGLSVGWGDTYLWNLGLQYVDITGLPAGRYRLTTSVNTSLGFAESNTSDGTTWVDFSLFGNTILVLGYGPAPTPSQPAPPPPPPLPWP
jgi:hypothetical protein